MMIKLLLISLLSVPFLATNDAQALILKPMKQSFTYLAKNKTKTFSLKNNENYKMRFRVEVFERSFSKKNKEVRVLSNDFKLGQSFIELKAGKTKKIKLQFVGDEVGTERSYILSITEIADRSNIKEKLAYLSQIEASLYIGSKSQRASLTVLNAVQINNNLELSFKNIGTKHIKLNRYKIILKQGRKKVSISFRSKTYAKLGQQIILPGTLRKITIENITKFSPGKVDANFRRLYSKK